MNIPSKEDTLKKWAPILESMGMTGSKADWMSEYAEMHSKNETTLSNTTTEEFPTLLPIAKQVFAKTVGLDIVPVVPIGGNSGPEMDAIRQDVKESVGPRGNLFYLDFQYGGTESNTTM